MPVAAPLIGAAAGLAGAAMSSSAVGNAADAQTAANQAAIAEQQREFNINQSNFAPWLGAGKDALSAQMNLLGLGQGTPATPGTTNWSQYLQQNPDVMQGYAGVNHTLFPTPESFAQWHYQNYGQHEGRDISGITTGGTAAQTGAQQQQAAIDQLQQSPLYQSLFRNGQDTLLNNAAATGGLRGGNTAHSLANFGSDTLAQVIQQQLANLGGISNTGNSSAGSLGSLNANTGNQISALTSQNGQSQAGGILGSAGIWNNAINGFNKSIGNLPIGTFGRVTPNSALYSDAANTIATNPSIF